MSSPQKILILEDDELDYQVLIKHMSSHRTQKYEMLRATSGAEAHALIAEHNFAAALVDHGLAGGDSGLDFIESMGGRDSAFPSIILTGMDFGAIEDKIINTGVYDYIEKIAVTRDLIDRAIQFAISTQKYEKRLRESARQAESLAKFNRDILTVVSREMQAPLETMISCSDIVAEHAVKKIASDAAVQVAFAARQVEGFLHDLAELVRLDYSASGVAVSEFLPSDVIQDAIDMVTANNKGDAQDLALEFNAPQTMALRGDSLRIRSVAVTLLKNAVRQSDGGDVRVTASYQDGVFSLRVEDKGAAPASQQVPDIHDGVASSAHVTSAPQGDVGIGLSICKRLLEQMNGTLVLESAPGGGSMAGFDVPLSAVTDKAA